jgi:outer membrane lipoprotein-sorting protein
MPFSSGSAALRQDGSRAARQPLKLAVAWLACCLSGLAAEALEAGKVVDLWLAQATNTASWQAGFTQIRSLRVLAQPLTNRGQVVFAPPDRFRWELGQPPETIAARAGDQLVVLYPRLRRAERYSLAAAQAGSWRDTLALLDAGFPRSRADLDQKFHWQAALTTNGECEVLLHPASAAAAKLLPEVSLMLGTQPLALLSTRLQFADGSVVRTDFDPPRTNTAIAPDLFAPILPADYVVREPLASPNSKPSTRKR